MNYTKNEFETHLRGWEKVLSEYRTPTWDELPEIDLYMDQVIVLMNRYTDTLAYAPSDGAMAITPPMINNYVKLKVMPAPQKKKYSKIHLAYLIMISSLKQALNIPTIQKVIPLLDSEDEIRRMYGIFASNQCKAFAYINEKIGAVANPIIAAADDNPDRMTDLALQIAVSANILKVLTEDIASVSHE